MESANGHLIRFVHGGAVEVDIDQPRRRLSDAWQKDAAEGGRLDRGPVAFTLIARCGGVLARQGHTEASVDLVRLAGCRAAWVNGRDHRKRQRDAAIGLSGGLCSHLWTAHHQHREATRPPGRPEGRVLTTGCGKQPGTDLVLAVYPPNVVKHLSGVEGLEHVPAEGAFIVAPNHTSYYDHFLLTVVLQDLRSTPIWYLTKSEAFVRTTSRVWHEWYSIPDDRQGPTTATMRVIRSALAAGAALCFYPEPRCASTRRGPLVPVVLCCRSRILSLARVRVSVSVS
jgi:Acyltransferase/3,4-dihydroxy-2-butanone 4-phosphate synthase